MLDQTLISFCRNYDSKCNKDAIDLFLKSSPNYPSLLSIIQTLQYAGIKAVAGKCDVAFLSTLHSPFLMHIKHQNEENIVMARWNVSMENLMIYSPKENRWLIKNNSDIIKFWDGVIIYTKQKPNRGLSLWHDLNIYIVIGVIILLQLFIMQFFTYEVSSTLLLITTGLVFSIYMQVKDYGYKNFILDKLCHFTAITDCERVSNSMYAYILGYSISDLSASFFLSQLIIALIVITIYNIPIILVLSPAILVVIPAFIYSFYSQLKVKSFCPYCILILIILIAQAILAIVYESIAQSILISLFTLVSTLLFASSAKIIRKIQNEWYVNRRSFCDLLSLKRKKYVIVNESQELICKENDKVLSLGIETAEDVVTTIISPSCKKCKEMVKEIFELLDSNIVSFKWEIVLGESSRGDASKNKDWIRCYISNQELFFNYIRSWSNSRGEYQYYIASSESVEQEKEISQFYENFKNTIMSFSITAFPRIALNGTMLSPVYNGSDIVYLLIDKKV
ncbi:MAG: vitamin K epoxide reductase family protein [Bacteroidales bacterium]